MTLRHFHWLTALAIVFFSTSCCAARIQLRQVSQNCHGKLTGSQGVLESPNFPNNYPSDQNCSWIIESPRYGDTLYLEFSDFDLEPGRGESCPFDYLEIKEGMNHIPYRNIGIFCGSVLPRKIVSTQQQVFLHFKSDRYFTKPGFRLDWSVNDPPKRAVLPVTQTSQSTDGFAAFTTSHSPFENCLSITSKLSGYIASHNYPGHYPPNTVCEWIIDVPEKYHLILNVVNFDLGWRSYSNNDCTYGYLEIRDGPDETSPLIGRYCSLDIPRRMTVTGNQVYLKFRTGQTTTGQGFLILWDSREHDISTIEALQNRPHHNNENCGEDHFYSPSGTIKSPNYPHTYPHNTVCEWIIEVPVNHRVIVDFDDFDLEYSDECSSDYLEIRNGSSRSSSLIGKYCGWGDLEQIISDGNKMHLRFRSNAMTPSGGFSLTWHSIPIVAPDAEIIPRFPETERLDDLTALNAVVSDTNICGGHFNSSHGVITSPNYPNNYQENTICEWIIQAPDQHQVTLNVREFDVTWQTECVLDFLQIRNGGTKTSPVLGKYCGTEIPSLIRSSGNRLYLKFRAGNSRGNHRFRIEWDSTTSGCGGSLTSTSGSISSPNYPEPYHNLANCYWDIQVSAGNIIELMIVDLDLEPYDQCHSDFLEIYDGISPQLETLGRYCQTDLPLYLVTSSNVASIQYSSNTRHPGRGFHMSYRTLCHNNISGSDGVIESPNFPIKYPHQRNCSWIIEAPEGHTVNLTFSDFYLEAGQDNTCPYDYVVIKEGTDNQPNRQIAKFCDSASARSSMTSTQRQVFVQFFSDGSLANRGFRLKWNISGNDPK